MEENRPDGMEKTAQLQELKRRLSEERAAPWEALPDIALYMDQLISYMPRQLIYFDESETLTSAMVNNYIKDGLLPRAEGKRYHRVHLAYLTAIGALKQVLSVKEVKALLQEEAAGRKPEALYEHFCQKLDMALGEAAGALDPQPEQEELAQLALSLALRSYAHKLACQRILALLKPEAEEEKKSKKKEAT